MKRRRREARRRIKGVRRANKRTRRRSKKMRAKSRRRRPRRRGTRNEGPLSNSATCLPQSSSSPVYSGWTDLSSCQGRWRFSIPASLMNASSNVNICLPVRSHQAGHKRRQIRSSRVLIWRSRQFSRRRLCFATTTDTLLRDSRAPT